MGIKLFAILTNLFTQAHYWEKCNFLIMFGNQICLWKIVFILTSSQKYETAFLKKSL